KHMSKGTGTYLAIIACAVLAVVVFFLVDFTAGRSFASPQEAFDASCKAARTNNFREWCQCFTTETRDLIVLKEVEFFVRETLENARNDDDKAMIRALAEVQAKHGLTEELLAQYRDDALAMEQGKLGDQLGFARKVLAPVSDPCRFFHEMVEVRA